ncbi:hypothetical protein [Aeromicrobium sp. NPDC092404]|uniref:hypothetical protein n=1 Tax=Aeromicrobium sp. NPDC092404 TaxID=3154976 RepID=UPI00343B0388
MSQPPDPNLPPYGTPPPQPSWTPPVHAYPHGQQRPPQKKDRTPDIVLSWLLYAGQVVGSGVMVVISIFAVIIDSWCTDGSGSCSDESAGSAMIGYWIALGVLLIGTLVGLIVATSTNRRLWPWAVGGFCVSVVATIVFFAVLAG